MLYQIVVHSNLYHKATVDFLSCQLISKQENYFLNEHCSQKPTHAFGTNLWYLQPYFASLVCWLSSPLTGIYHPPSHFVSFPSSCNWYATLISLSSNFRVVHFPHHLCTLFLPILFFLPSLCTDISPLFHFLLVFCLRSVVVLVAVVGRRRGGWRREIS